MKIAKRPLSTAYSNTLLRIFGSFPDHNRRNTSPFPYDVLYHIASFLDEDILVLLRSACKAFYFANLERRYAMVMEGAHYGQWGRVKYLNRFPEVSRYVKKVQFGPCRCCHKLGTTDRYLQRNAITRMSEIKEAEFRLDSLGEVPSYMPALAFETFGAKLHSLTLRVTDERLSDFVSSPILASAKLVLFSFTLFGYRETSQLIDGRIFDGLVAFINNKGSTLKALHISCPMCCMLITLLPDVQALEDISLVMSRGPFPLQTTESVYRFLLQNRSLKKFRFNIYNPNLDWVEQHFNEPRLLSGLESLDVFIGSFSPESRSVFFRHLHRLGSTLSYLRIRGLNLNGLIRVQFNEALTGPFGPAFTALRTLKISVSGLTASFLKILDSNLEHLEDLSIEYSYLGEDDETYTVLRKDQNRFVEELGSEGICFSHLISFGLYPDHWVHWAPRRTRILRKLANAVGLANFSMFEIELSKLFPHTTIKLRDSWSSDRHTDEDEG